MKIFRFTLLSFLISLLAVFNLGAATAESQEINTEEALLVPPPQEFDEQITVDPPAIETSTVEVPENNTPPSIPKCHEVPILISKCIPSICVEESPFGSIYRQVVAYDQAQNACFFKERTPGFGGLNCLFASESLDSIDQLYTKKFISRFDKSISLTEQESLDIKLANERYCEFLNEQQADSDPIPLEDFQGVSSSITTPAANNAPESSPSTPVNTITSDAPTPAIEEEPAPPITPEDDLPQPVEDNDFSDIDIDQEIEQPSTPEAISTPEQPVEQSEATDLIDNNDIFKFKSLMFTTDEISLLNQALDAYNSGSKLSIGSPEEEEEEEQDLDQIRSFFLKSLIYYNPDQWSVWLESSSKTEKITDSTNSSGLIIDDIQPEFVTIIWQTPNLDKIAPEWRRFLISDINNRYRHQKYDIVISSGSQSIAEVKFRLRPNQTLNVNKMQIIEGRIK